jgi:hypothetical protein
MEVTMTQDKNQNDAARKLSNEEMESSKGGDTFAHLSTFVVKSNIARPIISRPNFDGETVMCSGQTRLVAFDFGEHSPFELTALRGESF